MKRLWQRYAERYEALSLRERALIAGALLMLIALAGYLFAVEPQLKRRAALKQQAQQQEAQLIVAQAELQSLQARERDPDAAERARLAQLKDQTARLDARLRQLQAAVLPPEQMAALLEEILKRNKGLELVQLRSLPASPLIERKDAKAGMSGVLRHGVELTVAGSYAELAAYLGELEHMPQRVFWGSVRLVSEDYPRARLTLTVHTLSLEKAWLIL